MDSSSVLILGGGSHQIDHEHRHDHNLRSAYFHVLADALTSLLAIFALLTAKYAGLVWMDPVMGIVGAVLVARWSVGLMRMTGGVLLDRQAPVKLQQDIKDALEDPDTRVSDLHVWCIGPGIYAVIVSIVAQQPQPPRYYKNRLPVSLGLVHISVEVNQCAE